jgi:hypothetical protein
MSAAMLVRFHTMLRRLAARLALLAACGALMPATAPAASEANSVLFGKPTTAPTQTSSTPNGAQSQGSTTIKTNTAVTRTQAPVRRTQAAPTFSTPHIATTVPQSTATAPGVATPGTSQKPGASTTTPGSTLPSSSATVTATATATVPQTVTAPVGSALTPGHPATLRPVSHQSSSLSPVAIVAAVLAVLLIFVCLLWGFARWYAYEPHWTLALRHSLAEAGVRLSSTWDELADWTRLGR